MGGDSKTNEQVIYVLNEKKREKAYSCYRQSSAKIAENVLYFLMNKIEEERKIAGGKVREMEEEQKQNHY